MRTDQDTSVDEADKPHLETPKGWTHLSTISNSRNMDRLNNDIVKKDGGATSARGVNSEDGGPIEEVRSDDELLGPYSQQREFVDGRDAEGDGRVVYKVYKRRFFGLFQLALLNVIVSWDVSTFLGMNDELLIIESGYHFRLPLQPFLNSLKSLKQPLTGCQHPFCLPS